MKRTVTSILAALSCIILSAATVSEKDAKVCAGKFFSNGNVATVVISSESLFGSKSSLSAPAYYVFNDPDGGWVIISGEDSVNPVLAYSPTGSFKASGMPDNLRFWMSGLRDNINYARSRNLKRTVEVERAWQCIGERTKSTSSKTIRTALWDQGSPYNTLCPIISGESGRSLTGCVATAMAIMMRHYEWPESGTGTIPGYSAASSGYRIGEININGYRYDWSEMPLTDAYGSNWTNAQKKAVYTLIYHCGAMVEMDYGESGSSAYSQDIAPALQKHMGYSKEGQLIYRYHMPLGDWFFKIKEAIDNNQVLLYDGSDLDSGGHQFICDGYDVENCKISINWGWGGLDNGFYTLDLAIPGDCTFDYYQSCIFGLVPDKTGTSTDADAVLDLCDYSEIYSSYAYHGLQLISGEIKKGQTVKFGLGTIVNEGNTDYSGKIRLALIGFDGTVKQTIQESSFTLNANRVTQLTLQGRISCDLEPGDSFAAFYLLKDGSWKYLPWDSEYGTMMGAYGVSDARIIRLKNSYSAGERFNLDIMSITPGQKVTESVQWYVNGVQTSEPFIILNAGVTNLKATVTHTDGSHETISAKIII